VHDRSIDLKTCSRISYGASENSAVNMFSNEHLHALFCARYGSPFLGGGSQTHSLGNVYLVGLLEEE